jgi:CheY-like chemotaxis protein
MKIPAFYREIREGDDTNLVKDRCKLSESESVATATNYDIELGTVLGTSIQDSMAESSSSLMDDLERVDLSELSILVVDDATSTRKIMHRILKSKVKNVTLAEDGLECLEAIKNSDNAVDLILLDFEMPNLNGPDTVKELRKQGYTLPVIGVTGNVLQQDIDYFISCGANDVVSKPLKMNKLDMCIRKQWFKSRHVVVKT